MRISILLLTVAAVFAAALPSAADVNFGIDARFMAMGGAGLATTDSPQATATMNPAAFGLLSKRFSFTLPSGSFSAQNASLSDINHWASSISDLSGQDGIDLARQFGQRNTMLDVSALTGFSVGSVSAMLDGEARARITPNAAFQEFARTGVLPVNADQMQAVIQAEAATAMPAIGFGFKAPGIATGKGDLWIGARLRAMRASYVRRTVSWSGSADPDNLLVTSDEPAQDENGIGADLGLIYRTPHANGLSFGLAVTNLLEPSLGAIEQDRIISLGMAVRPSPKTVVVADIVNLNNGYGEGAKLRFGLEFAPIKYLALRAGYSGESFTTGFGLFGLDFAFASKTPMSIARTIRF